MGFPSDPGSCGLDVGLESYRRGCRTGEFGEPRDDHDRLDRPAASGVAAPRRRSLCGRPVPPERPSPLIAPPSGSAPRSEWPAFFQAREGHVGRVFLRPRCRRRRYHPADQFLGCRSESGPSAPPRSSALDCNRGANRPPHHPEWRSNGTTSLRDRWRLGQVPDPFPLGSNASNSGSTSSGAR